MCRVNHLKGVLIQGVHKGRKLQPRKERRFGTGTGPGCNGIQLKKGKLKMSITEDFLAERTARVENGVSRDRREAPSLRTLDTRQSQTVEAQLKEEIWH
jgi:hypothetical protein